VLGLDRATGKLPDDLTVVQVGDLVHTGPDSDAVVAFVSKMMSANGSRWVQLVGNHESVYIGGIGFGHSRVSIDAEAIIRTWVHNGRGLLATTVDSAAWGPLLVTHAGLTRELWVELGEPADPVDAARRLNRILRMDRRRAFAPGLMLQGVDAYKPGVVWAAAGSELYRSWVGRPVPFGQVHGHSSAWDWHRQSWRPWTPEEVTEHAVVDPVQRHLYVDIGGKMFAGIDPDWRGEDPGVAMSPLVVPGTVRLGEPEGDA